MRPSNVNVSLAGFCARPGCAGQEYCPQEIRSIIPKLSGSNQGIFASAKVDPMITCRMNCLHPRKRNNLLPHSPKDLWCN
ncbi:hypothetical protein PILCRDRAFT_278425 [Piloderma croceum F 1598]|uniref:Uncharacterized protein n=1 Tax=Piloderma croceum (strain F 1598) TaxID=765440 RepID=A0A0C3BLZ0_PILCF|nr:hypothetical protein PILCRDRAFT_278425 [Piloderma croceum F 1598]